MTYTFYPAIFFNLAGKTFMLFYIRATGNPIDDTTWTSSLISAGCSFSLCIYWTNM